MWPAWLFFVQIYFRFSLWRKWIFDVCDRFEGLMKSHSIQSVNISMLKQLIEESVRHHEQMCKVEFVVQGYSGCPPSEVGRRGQKGGLVITILWIIKESWLEQKKKLKRKRSLKEISAVRSVDCGEENDTFFHTSMNYSFFSFPFASLALS